MPRPATDKRDRVIQAATQAVYDRGFHNSSLSDIAERAGVPVGSVYYFFRAKQDLGRAVIDVHLAHYQARREVWDALEGPVERLLAFLDMTLENKQTLARLGCPVGTLCGELQKEGGELGEYASQVFAELLGWLEAQFRELGQGELSGGHAEHLLGGIEGATLLTHSFSDPAYVERGVDRLATWIRSL